MSKQRYEPIRDDDKVIWLNTFAQGLPQYSALLGIAAAEITSAQNDAAYFKYMMGAVDGYNSVKEGWVQYKNQLRSAPIGSAAGTSPQAPNIGIAPTLVAPGIMPRIHNLIARIKKNPNYTPAIGSALGIIGEEDTTDINTIKPVLKLVLKGGQVEVQWTKNIADGIKIEVDRSDNQGWRFLAVDTEPHYTDTLVPAAAANWKYRAMYLQHDSPVGLMSDVVSISVG
ncbi:MAG: hypothetical protein HY840_02595 [Bacteroidetes bacterium]|nr:hypothetical protein [Bacteroidota bacterium]